MINLEMEGDEAFVPHPASHIVCPKIASPFIDIVKPHENLFSTKIQRSLIGEHKINLKADYYIRTPPRRLPIHHVQKVKDMMQEYQKLGIIKRSCSPFCAPVVVVTKKDGDLRLCCDYRRLNDVTIRDSFPIPTFEEIRDSLSKAKIFSKFDLRSGYWQLGLSEDAQQKTAFSIWTAVWIMGVDSSSIWFNERSCYVSM